MRRSIVSMVCCCTIVLALGCAKMRRSMGMDKSDPAQAMHEMKKPEQPAEMKRLEPFVGNWTATAEMVTPPKQAKRNNGATTAPATQPQQTTMNGGSTGEWALNGMALRTSGWYEMPNGQRVNYIEYWMWDPQAKKYHTTFMSEMGEYGEGWVTPDASGRSFTYTGGSNRSKVNGTMRMADDRTIEWNMTEKGPHGKMQMKGTNRKQS